ncbi:MAG: DUF2155 domain-containing protein [Rhizomicrobium sp.]|jgi:hypothetical protein
MKLRSAIVTMAVLVAAAQAQSPPGDSVGLTPPPAPAVRTASVAHPVLELRALDKITGRASVVLAPLNVPVTFKTLTIVAHSCYSTPASETPETSAFLQIDDHRADQPDRRVFSGWMYASSPGLNGMQHPLYDVWAISCRTNAPGQAPSVTATAPVKVVSPNAGADEGMPELPEGAGQ